VNRALTAVLLLLIIAASAGFIYYWYMAPPVLPGEEAAREKPKTDGPPPLPEPGPVVSHETYLTEHTDARAVVSLRHAADFLRDFVPEEAFTNRNVPPGIQRLLKEDFAGVLPHEVALLGGADYENNRYEITLFINQRYFGVLVPLAFNQRRIPQFLPMLEWKDDEPGLKYDNASVAYGTAYLPFPQEVGQIVAQHWDVTGAPAAAPPVRGEHTLEVVIDNRDGDLLALVLAVANLYGFNPAMMTGLPQFQAVPPILRDIQWARIAGDVADDGALVADIELMAGESPSIGLTATVPMLANGMALPQINQLLQDFGLGIKGELAYVDGAVRGTFRVPGFEAYLRDFVGGGEEPESAEPEAPPVDDAEE
jgi:hypothetical protein